jgi:hypothetical protein
VTIDTTERVVICGYCGCGPVRQDLHAELYGMLSTFYHEHRSNQTWQHCHEWAARIEALFAETSTSLATPVHRAEPC